MKLGTRPKARSTKPVGPLAAGKATVSRAMTKASASAPAMVIAQPATPFQPNGARLAGRRNTPDPIILPMTSAMHIERPSLRPSLSLPVEKSLTRSEFLADLDADQARANNRVIEDTAVRGDPVGIAAGGFKALDAGIDDAVTIEQIGGEQLGFPAFALHPDADIGGRIGVEHALDTVFERAHVVSPFADKIDRELDM